MSDPRATYGEPVEEPRDVDDVVGRAHEGLADAEAARREAADRDTVEREAAARDAVHDDELQASRAESDADRTHVDHASTATAAAPAAPSGRWDDSDDLDPMYAQHADDAAENEPRTHRIDTRDDVIARDAADAPTVAVAPVAGGAAAVAAERTPEPLYTSPSAPQPIFVQAPEQPRPRGNRGAAGAIGLLAALVFAALYLAAWLGFGYITGEVKAADLGSAALSPLTRADFWVPVAVFFLGFWFLGAIINRGRWGLWVILGILVGVVSYVGHILGQLFQAPFWTLTASQGNQIVQDQLLAPLAIVAFVLGRELTIWFGAWVSSRGKRMTELNNEAQREYERTLEAGPQLVRA
ncbi:ABC transporter [Microbacterium sp. 1P10UB]|uniref:ABC transporter n=1 Tax=unclassified Microbacterium TaxID=2609290 RepID=UPI0039A2CE99